MLKNKRKLKKQKAAEKKAESRRKKAESRRKRRKQHNAFFKHLFERRRCLIFFLFFVCVLLPSLSASFPVVCFFFTKAMMWCERVRKKVSILLCVFSLCEWRWRWLYEETRNFVTIWTEVYSLPWYVLLQINRYANHLSLSLSLCNFYYIEAHH